MDVLPLIRTTATSGDTVSRIRLNQSGRLSGRKNRKALRPGIDKARLKVALDNIIRETRFQYVINDAMDYPVVKIIDKKTGKLIKEIPSRELQKVHESIHQALGLLFDELR